MMKNDERLSLELHIIQNFAPNNLNRDDVGSPKDCVFGGVRRSRISSQAHKRAMRQHPAFVEAVTAAGGDTGTRSRRIKAELNRLLEASGMQNQEERERLSSFAIEKGLGLKFSKQHPEQTEYLLYLGSQDLAEMARILFDYGAQILNGKDDQLGSVQKALKDVVSSKSKTYAADVALFGRMVADDKSLNVDAACQVAHSISTHRVDMDVDYFTAVDDLQPDEESGAGFIQQAELNGSCHYRYMNLDVRALWHNLGFNRDLMVGVIRGFLLAAAYAIPTGKQNSTAAQNPPYFYQAILRDDGQLWSLAGAFSRPVRISADASSSFEELSVERIEDFYEKLRKAYGVPEDVYVRTMRLDDETRSVPLKGLADQVAGEVSKRVESWEE